VIDLKLVFTGNEELSGSVSIEIQIDDRQSGGDEVVGDVAGVDTCNEVMEAYFNALNEITEDMNANRGNYRGDEDIVGDADSVFDGDGDADGEDLDVNIRNSAYYDCNGDEENECEGNESDYGDSEDLSERENTIVDDDVGEDSDSNEHSDTVNEGTDSDQNHDDLFIIDDVDDIVKIDMFNLDNDDVSKLQFGKIVV
ncbi:hypothetical protein A2U01_0015494, partial [Trifolium medium]|nr:hypothetical protein [Trifolium medium]